MQTFLDSQFHKFGYILLTTSLVLHQSKLPSSFCITQKNHLQHTTLFLVGRVVSSYISFFNKALISFAITSFHLVFLIISIQSLKIEDKEDTKALYEGNKRSYDKKLDKECLVQFQTLFLRAL